jgi:hypothetical protein
METRVRFPTSTYLPKSKEKYAIRFPHNVFRPHNFFGAAAAWYNHRPALYTASNKLMACFQASVKKHPL